MVAVMVRVIVVVIQVYDNGSPHHWKCPPRGLIPITVIVVRAVVATGVATPAVSMVIPGRAHVVVVVVVIMVVVVVMIVAVALMMVVAAVGMARSFLQQFTSAR